MAKRKQKLGSQPATTSTSSSHPKLATDLKTDTNLGYKLRVLLYDLRNMVKDRSSEARTLATTHPTYISGPYFTPDEADLVRNTVVILINEDENQEGETTKGGDPCPSETTVEQAIHTRLANFFEKRLASGDARPCGPHDMAPIYEGLFGISKEELQDDEKVLSRLRRCGLNA